MVSFERVFEYLDLPVEIEDSPDALALDQVDGHVRFEDVSFSYLTEPERLEIEASQAEPGRTEFTPRRPASR